MPRKDDQETATETEAVPAFTPPPVQETYFFPTVGNGVSVLASSREEAEEKIKKHPLHPSNLTDGK